MFALSFTWILFALACGLTYEFDCSWGLMTWQEAETFCVMRGSHLATIEDGNQRSAWLSQISALRSSGDCPSQNSFWIGRCYGGSSLWSSGSNSTYSPGYSAGEPSTSYPYVRADGGQSSWTTMMMPSDTAYVTCDQFPVQSNPAPTPAPTRRPTWRPTLRPTLSPTRMPTLKPTASPSFDPTKQPTDSPSGNPTSIPTDQPSKEPTKQPTKSPTKGPTTHPSQSPSLNPTLSPTEAPFAGPTTDPTSSPTKNPSSAPTLEPTSGPSLPPSSGPTESPSAMPTNSPSQAPVAVSIDSSSATLNRASRSQNNSLLGLIERNIILVVVAAVLILCCIVGGFGFAFLQRKEMVLDKHVNRLGSHAGDANIPGQPQLHKVVSISASHD